MRCKSFDRLGHIRALKLGKDNSRCPFKQCRRFSSLFLFVKVGHRGLFSEIITGKFNHILPVSNTNTRGLLRMGVIIKLRKTEKIKKAHPNNGFRNNKHPTYFIRIQRNFAHFLLYRVVQFIYLSLRRTSKTIFRQGFTQPVFEYHLPLHLYVSLHRERISDASFPIIL